MTNSADYQTLEGLIEHYTSELVEDLEFYTDKENGLGMNMKDAITAIEKKSIAGETPWKNALNIFFEEGN